MSESKPDLFKTLLEKKYPQNDLLTHTDFLRFLEQRRLRLDQRDLEFYEENEFVVPIARVFSDTLFDVTHTLGRYYEGGACVDPSKEKFCPWKEYKERAFALYHHWQSLAIPDIRKWEYQSIRVSLFYDRNADQLIETVRNFHRSLDDWREIICRVRDRTLKMLPLLLLIEDRYLPFIRNRFLWNARREDGGFQEWRLWIKEFDPRKVLAVAGLNVDEIEDWREWLAAQARFIDPLRDWYLLVGHVSYRKRQKLQGNALLAQDYFEIVKLLGMFIEDLTGERQLEPDDLLDARRGEWKVEWYGGEVDFLNRRILRKILAEYDLDTQYKVLFLVEGDTEIIALPKIARALDVDFDRLGIKLFPLDGYSGVSARRIEKLLEHARDEGIIAYIWLDNHPEARPLLSKIVDKNKLVSPQNVHVWDTDFEGDNFTDDELVNAVMLLAKKDGKQLSLTPEMIRKCRELGAKPQFVKNILRTLCHRQEYVLRVEDLTEVLGDLVSEQIAKGDVQRRVVEELKKVVQVAVEH